MHPTGDACLCACVCVYLVITFSKQGINQAYLFSNLVVVSWTGEISCFLSRSCLRYWFLELLRSGIPSRVGSFLYCIHTGYILTSSRDSATLPDPSLNVPYSPYHTIELFLSISGYATTARWLSLQDPIILEVYLWTGDSYSARQPHGLLNTRPSFPTPNSGSVSACSKEVESTAEMISIRRAKIEKQAVGRDRSPIISVWQSLVNGN